MDRISLLIKPASGSCNLRCRYCFYEDETEKRAVSNFGMMSEDTLALIVRRAMTEATGSVYFAFQGGEPMLAGRSFFQRFVELEAQYRKPGLSVSHSIQTNGTLIDEDWAAFFRDHNFLVGLSFDGTRELHDLYRVDPTGTGSAKSVLRAVTLLQKYSVEFNLLAVVTGQMARHGQKAYQQMKKLNVRHLQFVPCLDPFGTPPGQQTYSLRPEQYGRFLCTLFDLWYQDWERGSYVSIRLFDDYVHLLAGQPAGTCATNGVCGCYFTVEGNGNVYPCDFFAMDQWLMGNIREQSLEVLASTEAAVRFRQEGCSAPAECTGCQWLRLCNGGCRREWIGLDRNYHCAALKQFFAYAMPRLQKIADMERRLTGGYRPQ